MPTDSQMSIDSSPVEMSNPKNGRLFMLSILADRYEKTSESGFEAYLKAKKLDRRDVVSMVTKPAAEKEIRVQVLAFS